MDMAMRYELFLRVAFGYGSNGKTLDRYGDPAEVANTDCFNDHNIEKVKAATGYAMEIMSKAVINNAGGQLSDVEIDRLGDFTKNIINASDLGAINILIIDFDDTVVKKYFDISNGNIKLR